jgi:hypothetical protein
MFDRRWHTFPLGEKGTQIKHCKAEIYIDAPP